MRGKSGMGVIGGNGCSSNYTLSINTSTQNWVWCAAQEWNITEITIQSQTPQNISISFNTADPSAQGALWIRGESK